MIFIFILLITSTDKSLRTWPIQPISYNRSMLQNDPHNATETTKSFNCLLLDFCCGGHSFSNSEIPKYLIMCLQITVYDCLQAPNFCFCY